MHDLIDYAELHEVSIIQEKKFKNAKELLNQYKNSVDFTMIVGSEVKDSFNDAFIEKQMEIMLEMVKKSPADAVGKAKELLESCFKHILDNSDIRYTERESVEQLRKKTFVYLGIDANEEYSKKVNKDIKRLYSSLNQIVMSINSLRNSKGDGHGRGKDFREISKVHASLAVNASLTVVHFVWDVYKTQIF